MHRGFTQKAWTIMLMLLGSLFLLSSVVDGQTTTLPNTSVEPTITVPATGTATGTSLPSNTNGASPTNPSPTGPRPTRDPTAPLATITITSPPNRKDNPPLYALGSNIQFSWTIDTAKLLLQPTNITLDAIAQSRKDTFTIAVLPAGTTNFTWTAALQSNASHPLIEDLYTLRIYDGQVGPTGYLRDGGGFLQSNIGLVFGLYYPRGYNNVACDCSSPDIQQRCGRCDVSPITNGAHRALTPSGAAWALSVIVAIASASLAL